MVSTAVLLTVVLSSYATFIALAGLVGRGLNKRMDDLSAHLGARMDELGARLARVEARIERQTERIDDLAMRVARLEERLAAE